mgnify:CR=1 FL=1
MIQNNSYDADTLHEECGVFGMYDFDGADVASTIYYGLFALQHRGQESCGIAVSDTSGPKGKVLSYKGMGLVNEVFAPENLEQMKGDIGVGHVRYSTAGSSTRENAQPLVLNYVKGTLALAHNGNLINAPQLRKELEYTGAIFQTTIDSEVIAYHIARERLNSKTAEEAVRRACQKLKGAYALVVASPRKLIGARDPYGFKPLVIGKRDNAYIITSETCALETIDAEYVRDVLPGEVVTISPEGGIQSDMTMCLPKEQEARCIFEYIYFARPDSHIDGVSVYASRIQAGRFLAMDSPVDADLVVGVPESGNAAAQGYALQSGIPYGTAFVKNGYVGRTFIKPKQSSRESSVRVKLNVLEESVRGKRIIMIDDSIVRGTQLRETTEYLFESGAKEVHIRPACPPLVYGCKYLNFSRSSSEMDLITRRVIERLENGNVTDEVLQEYTDPDSEKYEKMVDEICKELHFTSLRFNRLDDMLEACGVEKCKLCTYCWDGKE